MDSYITDNYYEDHCPLFDENPDPDELMEYMSYIGEIESFSEGLEKYTETLGEKIEENNKNLMKNKERYKEIKVKLTIPVNDKSIKEDKPMKVKSVKVKSLKYKPEKKVKPKKKCLIKS